jgi:hypothetical protein
MSTRVQTYLPPTILARSQPNRTSIFINQGLSSPQLARLLIFRN